MVNEKRGSRKTVRLPNSLASHNQMCLTSWATFGGRPHVASYPYPLQSYEIYENQGEIKC